MATPPKQLPGLSPKQAAKLLAKAQKYGQRIIYLEDRAAQVKAGVASTWQKDRNVRDVQRRLDSLARHHKKDFAKYRAAMQSLYGPNWADFEDG